MLVVLLISINAIYPEFIAAQDLESTPPSTSNPFPTPYQGKQVNKSQIYPRREITLNKGQDNFKFISEHMNLMKLVNIMKGLFYVKSINSEQNYDLKNPRLYSEFRKPYNTYSTAKYSNKTNIAGKSKLQSRNQNSSDNGNRKVYGEKKSWIQFSTKNDPNDLNREIKNSYKDKLMRKKKNLDKSLQEIAKGQVQSDFSMKEKEKTKHDNNNKKDGFTKENIEAQKTEIEDAYSASNSSKERIHGQGYLLKFKSIHSQPQVHTPDLTSPSANMAK